MLHYSQLARPFSQRILRVPDPVSSTSETELRQHVERALDSQYDVDREIGRGGMGIVYLARDRRLKRQVAIKLLPPELAFRSEIRTRFMREAETAAQLNHPNIVPIYSVDERENLVYFVMSYVEGVNLGKRLHDHGRLGIDETSRVLCEVADALSYAHARGVIHRDIKPDNILLDSEHARAMVTDFGIARAVSDGSDSRLTATGIAIGTPAYMSPEQCAGDREIDGRADLYALGVVAYQMLTGELPFSASNTPAMLVKHISERPANIAERRADAPPDLARAVMMLLEKDPDNRFPDAAALLAALEHGNVPTPPSARAAARQSVAGTSLDAQPAGGSRLEQGSDPDAPYEPTTAELIRWNAEPVERYRRKVAPYLAVNAVIIVASMLGAADFLVATVVWTIIMAYKYARLWTEGYDWRDVFRQPRDRDLFDVTSETIEDVQAVFDAERRRERRERLRQRRLARSSGEGAAAGVLASPARGMAGARSPGVRGDDAPSAMPEVRQAALDLRAIIDIIESMPRNERSLVSDVVPSARALHERIGKLAASVQTLERGAVPDTAGAIEAEISKLEAAANPLDRPASEERVRRLAYLKRQRRSVGDVLRRRANARARLEQCVLALQGIRFDVLRLRAGTESHEHVTSLASEALALARDVDIAVDAAEEVARLTVRRVENQQAPRGA